MVRGEELTGKDTSDPSQAIKVPAVPDTSGLSSAAGAGSASPFPEPAGSV